jgi:hypothetical protein
MERAGRGQKAPLAALPALALRDCPFMRIGVADFQITA